MIRKHNEVDKIVKTENENCKTNNHDCEEKNLSNIIMNNKHCCVCLNNFLALSPLSKSDENGINYFKKLQINIPQVHWEIDFDICGPCTNLLNIVDNFREVCLKSDIKRQQFENYKSSDNLSECDDAKENDNDTQELKNGDAENDSEDDEKIDTNDTIINNSEENDNGDPENPKRKQKISYACEICSKVFQSSPSLTKHCVSEHAMIDRDLRPFMCSRCGSRFGSSSNLIQHVKYHDAIRSNICPYCGKGFITKTDLNIHEKQHLNKREYECDICNKCYNTHKDLRSHKLVVHTDPDSWKFFCQMCDKRFPIKSNYDCHMRRHTGEKRFDCNLCTKKFTDKCVLQRHMRTHTDVRDYKCSECMREYKDRRVMQIHMARVHGIGLEDVKIPPKERKYQCHICPKAYFAKNKLTRHLYTHSGEKPFFCTICDKKFNDKSYVKQHMKKSHNIDAAKDGQST